MKKLLIIALLTASTAQAGNTTGEVKHPFIANGGFKGLCDRLEWYWGIWQSGGINGGETYACLSDAYIKRNNITDFDRL
jgi:hypothetical protein